MGGSSGLGKVAGMTAQDLLTGPDAGELLAVAVEAAGGRLLDWRPIQVDQQDGTSTVAYRTRLVRDGRETSETLCATTFSPLPAGVTVLAAGEELQVGVWAAAADPSLPGMRAAMDPRAVGLLFERCGLRGGPVRLRLRAYRPLRRAVVEAVGPAGRLYLKVVAPDKVQALHERHRLLTESGVLAPRSLGWSSEGIVVLEALPGRSVRSTLRVDPAELLNLLDALPTELLAAPRKTSWLERTTQYAGMVGAAVPELMPWATELADAVVADSTYGPPVPVHGDFYEGQLLVDAQGNLTGVLDLDGAGPGDRLDDLACLVGHLSVLAQVLPGRAAEIEALGARCLSTFDRAVDPRQLRLRIASVVLSLATGPHRVQEAGWRQSTRDRLALAESWLDEAHRGHRKGRKHHVRTA